MDYEKKYKEALEIAQKLYQDCPNGKNDRLYHTTDLEKMFPELCESEDEKIRKELIEHVKDQQSSFISAPDCRDKYEEEENDKYNSWLAWLEKQGEQSSLNINRECLKGIKRVQEYQDLSDWEKEFDKIASMYAHNKNQEGYNDSWYVKERAAEMLYYAKKELEKQGGQKPAWSCEDETRLQACLDTLQANSLMGKVDTVMTNWLKSLKNRIKGE
mgnify:CR=1 FL=1